jgi:hypothetical protein
MNSSTVWSKILPEKPVVTPVRKKFFSLYGTLNFMAVLIGSRH